ncbi:spore protease YyaC [Paenibacillus agilis]|uniref:Spore protease YyaC n=1 Tax=Paenibacillus agilis TaxID=3020863 RepID=A0A559IGF5_9BACL|nr:spore protease YyaC [Paenibacillus agilis]TVX86746.1 spore protease YyaC [Paenibacillus agilis]
MVDHMQQERLPTNKPQKCTYAGLVSFLQGIVSRYEADRLVFVCIGTDRSTGDAIGPLVGTKLQELGYTQVIGTLADPCDASSLERYLASIDDEKIVVAIDACLGHPSSVGHFLVNNQSLQPAESVGTSLPAVGHYSIAAVVNQYGPKPYITLQTTSLFQVMRMVDQIVDAIAATVLTVTERS